jgi:acetyl/propionyl-CoA carboxylase alpha subunit
MVETVVLASHASATGETVHVFHAARAWAFDRIDERKRRGAEAADGGAVTAPLTGRIVEVAVHLGQEVQAGQKLLVLEAMKMEHTLTAVVAGVVSELNAQAGGQSAKGALLMRITPQP